MREPQHSGPMVSCSRKDPSREEILCVGVSENKGLLLSSEELPQSFRAVHKHNNSKKAAVGTAGRNQFEYKEWHMEGSRATSSSICMVVAFKRVRSPKKRMQKCPNVPQYETMRLGSI